MRAWPIILRLGKYIKNGNIIPICQNSAHAVVSLYSCIIESEKWCLSTCMCSATVVVITETRSLEAKWSWTKSIPFKRRVYWCPFQYRDLYSASSSVLLRGVPEPSKINLILLWKKTGESHYECQGYRNLKQMAQNRQEWRRLIHGPAYEYNSAEECIVSCV